MKWNMNIPDGTRDILWDEAELYGEIQGKLSDVYRSGGFRPIITPALEYYDVFDYSGQAIPQEEMYKLTDSNGRLIVLRADNTTPSARIAATRLRMMKPPYKLYYNQNVYRINTDFSGKRSETLQSGIEIIGSEGVKSDLACISTAFDALASLGIEYKIEIGHVGFYNAIIEELPISEDEKKLVRGYVDAKNAVSLELLHKNIPDESFDKIRRIPLLYGGEEVFEEALGLAEDNKEARAAVEYVSGLFTVLKNAGYGDRVMVDMGMIHKIDYYTGVVFAGYVDGAGEPVLKGGRYDNLIANFTEKSGESMGASIPATGFAINVCLVADALGRKKTREESRKPDCVIHFSVETFAKAEKLREEYAASGKCAELSCFETFEETYEYAKSAGIRHAADVTSGVTTVTEAAR